MILGTESGACNNLILFLAQFDLMVGYDTFAIDCYPCLNSQELY